MTRGGICRDRVRRGFYRDSAALMRVAQALEALPGVTRAALLIGSPSNRALLAEAGLLGPMAESAGPNDLVIALRAVDDASAEAALAEAERLLEASGGARAGGEAYRPRGLHAACNLLPGANLALISVPGDFAGEEAMKALRRGLHVMVFSDNVPLAEERALKEEAAVRGLLMMGPDCGTAIIAGAPLGFANAVPRGEIGIVAASGTGLQEVACLIARAGHGVSHAIGVGGRDLSAEVGGLSTLAAIAALDEDPGTRSIVLVSKPPAAAVAARVLERVGQSRKPIIICFLGLDSVELPVNARLALTLRDAALMAVQNPPPLAGEGRVGDLAARAMSANSAENLRIPHLGPPPQAGEEGFAAAREAAARLEPARRWIRGLYSGGTLAAEAQLVLRRAGASCLSNVPVPGAGALRSDRPEGHAIIDLGDDFYTRGRPHVMIEPAIRVPHLEAALADPSLAVILLDVMLGHGAHHDPAAAVVETIRRAPAERPALVASLCGTAGDPQGYDSQAAALRGAGVILASSNAEAAALALRIARRG